MPGFMRALRHAFRRPSRPDAPTLGVIWIFSLLAGVAACLLLAGVASAGQLSAGDSLRLVISDGEEFAGDFQLDPSGNLVLPVAGAIHLAGLSRAQAAAKIAGRLVEDGYFKKDFLDLTLLVLDWAPVHVTVAGAVYQPGVVQVNLPDPRQADLNAPAPMPGAEKPRKYLPDALRAAGGVTPDADLANVLLIRDNETASYDLRGYFTGDPVEEIFVVNGDRIVINSSGKQDVALIRPSLISPPGIKIFVSNLVVPSASNSAANAPASGVAMPYGSRFSQAVVAANCAGGTGATNAARHAVLVRTDRVSGATRHWRSALKTLLRAQDGQGNPLLMEGDALYCLDSGVTNVRDLFRTATDILLPFNLRRFR